MKYVLFNNLSRCLRRFLGDRSFCVRTRYGFKINVRPGKGFTELSQFLFRSFAAEISNLILALLPKGGTFIDVGAHVGWFSKLASYKVGEEGVVIAVEPEPENFKILEVNLRDAVSKVFAYNVALGDHCYKGKLYLAEASSEHSLIHKHGTSFVEVDVIPGDYLFADVPRADLIKVDVEGAELEVLKGMKSCLERWREVKLIVEVLAKDMRLEQLRDFYQFGNILGFSQYFIERLPLYANRLPRLYSAPLQKWPLLPYPNVLMTREPLPGLTIVEL